MSSKKDIDRGAQFSLSPDIRVIFRKRSHTYPSLDRSGILSPLYDTDNDNDNHNEDNNNGDKFENSDDRYPVFTPSNRRSNQTFGRNIFNDFRSSTGASPMTPMTPMSHSSDMNAGRNLIAAYDRFQTPITSNSFSFSNMPSPCSSLLTPVSLVNSPHFRCLNYNPFYGHTIPSPYGDYQQNVGRVDHSDRVTDLVRQHKNAATHAEARHTWSGVLPNGTSHKTPVYSCKVFLGGVPWEMTDHDIKLTFSRFGNVTILRPGQHVKLSRTSQNKDKAGYLYLIFESDKQVKSLINACTHDFSNGGKYYFALNQSRYRPKDVQIIPWNTNDVNYVRNPSARLDTNKTVFVGALHGMLTAEGLACILEDLFGSVVYVGIDTDKYKYPIGSGRVTFSSGKAYNKAVQAAFIDVKSNRFQKKIQIDPFLEESNCNHCHSEKGPIFCRDLCMTYFCRHCWDLLHSVDGMRDHQPIMRTKTKF